MRHATEKNRPKGSPGIALIIALAAVTIMTGIVVEFFNNSNVTYNLAVNEKERLQAYYLAESALSFSKLLLKFDKEAKKLAGDASKKLGRSIQLQPLYEMIPIDTRVLRGLAQMNPGGEGDAGNPSTPGAGGEFGEKPGASPTANPAAPALGAFNLQGAQGFLTFEGDFSAEVIEEDAKLNLNAFFSLAPTQKEYDRLKSILYHLLLSDEFAGMFQDRFGGAQDLAQNIADYIDRDDAANQPGGQERGREGIGGAMAGVVKMKNSKLLTLEELMMVPGMTDDIFQKLKNYVTVYGKDEKVMVCRAKDPLVRAMILAYTENNSKMEPLKDDNTDKLTKATDAVLNSCPDIQSMANELDKVLGTTQPSGAESSPSGSATTLTGSTSPSNTPASTTADTFTKMVKTEGNIYTVIGTGTVGGEDNLTVVKLKMVLDTTNPNPNQWQELYWRVE